jgi:hypothetical protein
MLWALEKRPDLVIPPSIAEACLVDGKRFFVTSARKGRNIFSSVQRNLGLSGKPEKIGKSELLIDVKQYERGLFLWIKDGKITNAKQLAKRRHPYCPATFEAFSGVVGLSGTGAGSLTAKK